jgi:glycosyltransferase involved in cell wall biosynthesis
VKLIFVNRYFHPDHSATAQLLSDLAFHLAGEGCDVHVVTSRSRYDDPAANLPRQEDIRQVRVHRVAGTRFGRAQLRGRLIDYFTFHVTATLALWRLARPGDLIVAKTDPPLLAVSALPVVRVRGACLVNWLQDMFPEVAGAGGLVSGSGLVYRFSRRLRDRALTRATLNVAVSHAMKRHLGGLGVDQARIRVIPNWSDGQAIYPVTAERNELRRSWGLGDSFVVGYSGNLGRVHDIDTVGQAVERFRGRPDITFVFIGGGSGYQALQDRIADRAPETAQFRPYQPRDFLHLSLSTPDVHLVSLAPEMEGLAFASKLYGVLAAGRPVIFIGVQDGEVARLVREADCGISVESGDPCSAMGRRARALFERDFDQDIALGRWKELLLGEVERLSQPGR